VIELPEKETETDNALKSELVGPFKGSTVSSRGDRNVGPFDRESCAADGADSFLSRPKARQLLLHRIVACFVRTNR